MSEWMEWSGVEWSGVEWIPLRLLRLLEKIVNCNELTVSAEVAPVTCVQTRSGKFNLPGDPFNKVQGLWEVCNGVKTDDSKV